MKAKKSKKCFAKAKQKNFQNTQTVKGIKEKSLDKNGIKENIEIDYDKAGI